MRSTGKGSMMTPVEKGSTCSGCKCSCCATATQVARARASPSAPVPALALPVLTTMARIALLPAKCSRQTCTGAAQKRFCVNTPATVAPSSSKNTVRSLRFALRTPASVTPIRTPAMACKSAATGAMRFTGIGSPSKNGMLMASANVSSENTGRSPCHKGAAGQTSLPWHCLYFLPLPQGQGSLRPTRTPAALPCGICSVLSSTVVSTSPVSVGEL